MDLSESQEHHTFRRELRGRDLFTRCGEQILFLMDYRMFDELAEPSTQWSRADLAFQLRVLLYPVLGIGYGLWSADSARPVYRSGPQPYNRIHPEL